MRARPLAFVFLSLFAFVAYAQAQSAPSISSLSQPLGPGATPITISGANFGATQGASFVTFGSTVAPPSSWSDTSLVVPVPNSLAAGNLNITVTVGGVPSNSAPFTVIPVIYQLSTYSASPGTQVTITGVGFGDTQNSSTLAFNGIASPASSWSNTSIVTSVPAGASTGPLVVTVNTLATNSVNFTVPTPAPTVTSLSPGLGPVGTSVTITGTNFGDTQGSSRVLFPGLHGSPASFPTSWSATSITVPVPTDAITGRVSVMVNGRVSNSLRFVIGTLNISGISPSSGAPGTTVTITGSGFGATQTTSLVTFNGAAAAVSSWTDTQIVAIVPNNATSGNVVVVENNTPSNGVSFTVATPPPMISSISPTTGAPGTTVTITGSGFGATQGSSTVTFNGIVLPVISWSDTQIVIAVPSGATSGNIVITVNGTVSNSFFFTVVAPLAITNVSPQSAVPGAPVTIFGTSFGASQGSGQVLLGNAYGTVLLWTDTRIVADVNGQAQSGVAQVFQNGAASNQFSFTVLSPASGAPTVSPAPNAYGWNNTDATVTFCAVAGNCSSPQTVTSEGANQVISGTVFGFGSSTVSVTLNIDKTPPALSVTSPLDGTTFSSPNVAITGTVSDALSGLASVTCNGVAATFGGSQFSCNISPNVGINLVAVRATDLAGNVAGSNFHLTLTGTLPAPNALQITPIDVKMAIGESRQFAAIDELGRPRPDASWAISDSSLASMSTDGPSTLTALASGQLTLTANVGSRSAQTQVNILGGSSLSPGTVRWSAPPLSGLRNHQVVHAVPAPGDTPGLYSIDEDINGNAVVRGFSVDGRQFWQASVPATRYFPAVPDGFGGNMMLSDSLPDVNNNKTSTVLDLDGITGSAVWTYASPNQINGLPSVRQDGTLFFVELTPLVPNGNFTCSNAPVFHGVCSDTSMLVALDPLVGTPQARWPLPSNTRHSLDCDGNAFDFGTDAPVLSNVAIDSDRTLAVEVEVETTIQGPVCNGTPTSSPRTNALSLFQIKADGSSSMIAIHSFSYDTAFSNYGNQGRPQPERVIPDGSGGWLAAWTDWSVKPALVKVTHITSSGQTDFSFPSLYQDIFSMVLGDNGAAYATDSQTIQAFDVNSGQSLWTYVSPAVLGTDIVASGNGTLIGEDFDQNAVGTIMQFDQAGNPSPVATDQPPDLPTPSWTGDWVTSAASGSGPLGIALPVSLGDANFWPTLEGDPSQNGTSIPLCPCLVQSAPSTSSNWVPNLKNTSRWARRTDPRNPRLRLASYSMNEFRLTTPRPSLATLRTPAPQSGGGSSRTYVLLVGDPGINTADCVNDARHCHNVGNLFNFSASTQADALTVSGLNTVIPKRVSSVQDFNAGLTANGLIDGGVMYFGHAAQQPQLDGSLLSILAPGQSGGTDTNVSALNVATLSSANLGSNATITLNACNAGLRPIRGAGHSIAQLLANQLNKPVYAWKVGMFFSEDPSARFPKKPDPQNKPIYMIPLGGTGVTPCTFTPNQPEPQKCGGVK